MHALHRHWHGRRADLALLLRRQATFTSALEQGAEKLVPEEAAAIRAFTAVLGSLFGSRAECTVDEWVGFEPPEGSFTDQQARVFVRIVGEVLEDESSVRGLLESIKGAR
jgi:hypothetical protein